MEGASFAIFSTTINYLGTVFTLFSPITELLQVLYSPPPTTTTINISLPDYGISSPSGSLHPTTLHQTSNDSSVMLVPVISTAIVSQPIQSMPTLTH